MLTWGAVAVAPSRLPSWMGAAWAALQSLVPAILCITSRMGMLPAHSLNGSAEAATRPSA